LGLDQAMRKVAEEMKRTARVIADEFGLCNFHLQMGKARNDVLRDLGQRTGVDDVRSLAAILIQADKFGSSVAQALRVQSDSMRTRRRQLAEEKAAKTAVKLIFPLVLTWSSDIGAFFVGRAIGGRKLIPSVSPGKTVAGAVGGLVASMLVSWLYARSVLVPVASLGFTPWGALGFGAIISVAAQVGDLFESLLKREGGVKDSSRIIPGHGGILDRFDSLIFVLPVAYLLLGWLPIPLVR